MKMRMIVLLLCSFILAGCGEETTVLTMTSPRVLKVKGVVVTLTPLSKEDKEKEFPRLNDNITRMFRVKVVNRSRYPIHLNEYLDNYLTDDLKNKYKANRQVYLNEGASQLDIGTTILQNIILLPLGIVSWSTNQEKAGWYQVREQYLLEGGTVGVGETVSGYLIFNSLNDKATAFSIVIPQLKVRGKYRSVVWRGTIAKEEN
jgi:hypothetical protein